MVDQGYCEGKAMRMIRLRRELGVNSDVMAKVIYRLRVKTCFLVGINIEGGVSSPGLGIGLSIETSMLTLRFQVKGPVLRLGFLKIYRNIELHLVIASDPDVRAMARLSFSFTDRHVRRLSCECRFRVMVRLLDVNGHGEVSQQARANLRLPSWDAVENELQDYGGGMTDVDDDGGGSLKDARARGDCAIHFHSYSEAGLISIVMVEFQAKQVHARVMVM
ncbi:Double-Stranded Rna-Binding Protein Staufen-like 2 [Manis pentadactyla]|nr:Double-Stranded Rna-Binding Protein Staufen-like 2 [Manis pentadactyla]